jgi:alpha-D-ribose 1-methylphosphonate 5-triphosphate synthase subunit PhnI
LLLILAVEVVVEQMALHLERVVLEAVGLVHLELECLAVQTLAVAVVEQIQLTRI